VREQIFQETSLEQAIKTCRPRATQGGFGVQGGGGQFNKKNREYQVLGEDIEKGTSGVLVYVKRETLTSGNPGTHKKIEGRSDWEN